MNKHARKIVLHSAMLTAALISLIVMASCSNESIFASIESEIKLKDPSITGTVTNVAEYGGSLYAANGRLMRKVGTSRTWERMTLPTNVSRCSEVASSGGALFAICQDAKWAFLSLQRYDGTDWTPVDAGGKVIGIRNGSGYIYAFREDTADYSQENINATYSVLRISDAGSITSTVDVDSSRPTAVSGNYFSTSTTVYNGGSAIDPGTVGPTAGIRGVAASGGILYALTNGYVYRYNGGTWMRFAHDVDTPVTALAWLKNASKNVLLVAGNEGYGEVTLNASDEPIAFQWPGSEDSSSISTEARKEYVTNLEDYNTSMISVIYDTSVIPAGDEYALYLGVVDKEYDGLWGYYQTTQPVWNRE